MEDLIAQLADRDLVGDPLTPAEAEALLASRGPDLTALIAVADRVRETHSGRSVRLCGIVNARSGGCSEDCAFCAQARGSTADSPVYALLDVDAMVAAAHRGVTSGARRFSIVTSGRGVHREPELERIAAAVRRIQAEARVPVCASLGVMAEADLAGLREAGLTRYHHNLEAAPSLYPEICSSHPIDERLATARHTRAAGLELCCGGILGLGESPAQRIELLTTIAALQPDAVPLNFLNPIPGTRLADRPRVAAVEALAVIAVARLLLPTADVILCGGREVTLGPLQPLALLAGANGLMIGDYLTTVGQAPAADLAMIAALGFTATAGCA